MGIVMFWRCDYCESETESSQPLGWRLKGELTTHAKNVSKQFDLFFCGTLCGEQWFREYHEKLVASNQALIGNPTVTTSKES